MDLLICISMIISVEMSRENEWSNKLNSPTAQKNREPYPPEKITTKRKPVNSTQKLQLRWRDYVQGRQEARKMHQPLFILFGNDEWDYWSISYKKKTFTGPQIVNLISGKMVPVFVNYSREGALVNALRVVAYPTVLIANPDGKILGTIEGFRHPEHLEKEVQEILRKEEGSPSPF